MRYLKTFEGFGHLDFDNYLFKQIDYENFEEMVSSQSVEKSCVSEEVSDEDRKWFINLMEKNIFSPYQLLSAEKVKRIGTDKIESVIRVKLVPKFNNDWTEILLYKFQDEYWVVECMGYGNVYFQGGSDWTYWACDTKQGVEDWCKYYFEHLKNVLMKESFSNEDPLYFEVGELNPDEKSSVKMDESLIKRIESLLLPEFTINKKMGWCRIDIECKPNCPACNYHLNPVGQIPKHNSEADFYIDIFELDDEWFDVEYLDARDSSYGRTMFNSHYYRCDGVEGLLKFLKDENIIK